MMQTTTEVQPWRVATVWRGDILCWRVYSPAGRPVATYPEEARARQIVRLLAEDEVRGNLPPIGGK